MPVNTTPGVADQSATPLPGSRAARTAALAMRQIGTRIALPQSRPNVFACGRCEVAWSSRTRKCWHCLSSNTTSGHPSVPTALGYMLRGGGSVVDHYTHTVGGDQ